MGEVAVCPSIQAWRCSIPPRIAAGTKEGRLLPMLVRLLPLLVPVLVAYTAMQHQSTTISNELRFMPETVIVLVTWSNSPMGVHLMDAQYAWLQGPGTSSPMPIKTVHLIVKFLAAVNASKCRAICICLGDVWHLS